MQATPTLEIARFRQMDASARIRFGFLVALTLSTIVIAIIALLSALNWYGTPFLGATINPNMLVNAGLPSTSAGWNGLDAGLEIGDQIISINETPVRSPLRPDGVFYTDILRGIGNDADITVTFNRLLAVDEPLPAYCGTPVDQIAICTLSYQTSPLPIGDFLALFVIPFGSGLTVLVVTVILLLMRPSAPHTFPIVIVGLLLATHILVVFEANSTTVFAPLWMISGVLIGGMCVMLGMIYPNTTLFVNRRPWIRYIPLVVAVLISVYVVATYRTADIRGAGTVPIVGASIVVGLAVMAAFMWFYQRPFAPNLAVRQQANIVFIGLMLGMIPTIFWVIGQVTNVIIGERVIPFSIEATMPFFIVPILGIVYATLMRPEWDTDRFISRSITYGIMFLALVIGYFLLVLGASLVTTDVFAPRAIGVRANNPFLIALTIFIISMMFIPVRTSLQKRIDRIYYRTQHNYQDLLEKFNQKLTSLAGTDVMIREFRQLLEETFQPVNTFIFLLDNQSEAYVAYGDPFPETDVNFTKDGGVVDFLKNRETTIYLQPYKAWPTELHVDRARLNILKVSILSALVGSTELNGFVCIGPARSGRPYVNTQLRFVDTLVGQLAIAIERSQVIRSLERRVRELDVLQQVGQAVNFTIQVNDLLELISTQILKLIEADYFYIVLHDANTDMLYYAFFLEHDEREESRENLRWPAGSDLYSEILKRSQPLRLEDYARTMQQRGYNIQMENAHIRAWMGVPLISGAMTLGVVAAGTSDPTVRYTNEQFNIFSNIGALAAASIEKARLFTETNTRARQLSALNDISRELVATEGNIDRLLDLITSRAVEILNAEAGSLLLTAEDGSGDLEFKAAFGGTGHELIGTRLPAGHGIVGEVATTGKPRIVHDTMSEARWSGEVVPSGFHTASLLAVPLVAQESIIGVLEIINKKDGSIFVEDDVKLSTTFAGQAAIALENARLLKQTDEQLSQRVQELEALELIDRELNKTLDIRKVAEITIRWAIAQSGATTGLLGIVTDDGLYVRVAARYGYAPEDLPMGAEDELWPIDKGIVKRVMRTRNADLQPDVAIDPDYVPSLKNGRSQITVPLMSGSEVNALLVLESNRDRFGLLDLAWVQRLAEHASIAIANAQLYEELTRANDNKSEFVAFAAHELKNPLTSVKGYADTMRGPMSSMLSQEQMRTFAEVISTNADRMQNIIDDLRDIAASDAGKLEIILKPISFRNVLEDTLVPFQKQFEEKQQTVINCLIEPEEKELPLIMADYQKMIQVLTNFVSNAHKYSPPKSTITIDANVERRFITNRNRLLGDVLRISVTDTGIGMSEDDLKRIFREDYFRSPNEKAREQKGTGLGMMITKRIIEGHHGDVWVESELEKGSTFHFVIPLASEEDQIPDEAHIENTTEPASD
ncbi:MAG: hypothetical protein OHK0046_30160 [Anaerolineae bacterium]